MMDANYQKLYCTVLRQILNQKITYSEKINKQDLVDIFECVYALKLPWID